MAWRLPWRLALLSILPALASPHRQNSKRMSIWEAVPDTSFRSGETCDFHICTDLWPIRMIRPVRGQQTKCDSIFQARA